jgi:hypothetical protein
MIWNYRVIKNDEQYSVYEVYYRDPDMRIVEGFSAVPSYPRGETQEGLIEDMKRYSDAFNKPVLYTDENGAIS